MLKATGTLGQMVNAYVTNLRFSKSWKPFSVSDLLPSANCTVSVEGILATVFVGLSWILILRFMLTIHFQ